MTTRRKAVLITLALACLPACLLSAPAIVGRLPWLPDTDRWEEKWGSQIRVGMTVKEVEAVMGGRGGCDEDPAVESRCCWPDGTHGYIEVYFERGRVVRLGFFHYTL